MHPLETEIRTWLQNWKTADAVVLERISVEAKVNSLFNVYYAAEEFLDANWGGNSLEPAVSGCLVILERDYCSFGCHVYDREREVWTVCDMSGRPMTRGLDLPGAYDVPAPACIQDIVKQ